MDKEMKIAVLIDAENISSKYAGIILQEAASLGNVIYKRIYGNWTTTQLGSWKSVMLENAIQPIQQYSNTVGKNSSDSALIIDAMDLLYQHRLDAFCIVSSDSDFTRLATRLRESEMYVLGMGERKTPRSFISACNKFSYLDLLYKSANKNKEKSDKPAEPSKGKDAAKETSGTTKDKGHKHVDAEAAPAEKPKKKGHAHEGAKAADIAKDAAQKAGAKAVEDAEELTETYGEGFDINVVMDALCEIAEERGGDDGWIHSGNLGHYLSKRLPDFDARNFGFKKFSLFVQSLPMFEAKEIPSTSNVGSKNVYFRLIEE